MQDKSINVLLPPQGENGYVIAGETFAGLWRSVTGRRAKLMKWNGALPRGNTVVIGSDEVVNPHGLRYGKELVNHKILDFIGDLYTSGYRILGKVEAFKTGHYLNNMLLREIFSDSENYVIY